MIDPNAVSEKAIDPRQARVANAENTILDLQKRIEEMEVKLAATKKLAIDAIALIKF